MALASSVVAVAGKSVNGNERHLHLNDHLEEVALPGPSPRGPFLRGNRAPRPAPSHCPYVYIYPLRAIDGKIYLAF